MVTFAEAKAQRITQLESAIAAEATNGAGKNIEFLWQQWAAAQTGSSRSEGGGTSSEAIAQGVDQSSDIEAIRSRLQAIADSVSNGDASQTKQDNIILGLSSLISELKNKADLTETQPVSLDDVPLAAGAATLEKQDLLLDELALKARLNQTQPVSNQSLGLSADVPATSSTGTFSFISLFKRYLAHLLKPRLGFGISVSASGDNTIIAAPAAGTEIVLTALRIQAATANTTTCLIRRGASDTTPFRLRTVADSNGLSEIYGFSEAIRCGSGNAFILNFSAANAHGVSVLYYVTSTTTGLPV